MYDIYPLFNDNGMDHESEKPVEKIIHKAVMAESESDAPHESSKTMSLLMRSVLWSALVISILTIVFVVYKHL